MKLFTLDYLIAQFNVNFCCKYLQCFTLILAMCVVCGYLSLVTTLIAVAEIHIDRVKLVILEIIHQYIMPHYVYEAEQVHTIAN